MENLNRNSLELVAALEVLPGSGESLVAVKSAVSPLVVVVVSSALRYGLCHEEKDEKIVDMTELTNVDENTFHVAYRLRVRN